MSAFLLQFFEFAQPLPFSTVFSSLKANTEIKLLLEIWTNSQLKMHTDPKNGKIHYTCKKFGGDCFNLVCDRDFKSTLDSQDSYVIVDDYRLMSHKQNCEETNIGKNFLTIYNLLKIKKDLIEQFMRENGLMEATPSQILSQISSNQLNQGYFFQNAIGGNAEYRKILRKRFDNIINIDIKKIGDKVEKEKKNINKPKKERKTKFSFENLDDILSERSNKEPIKTKKIVKPKKTSLFDPRAKAPLSFSKENSPKQTIYYSSEEKIPSEKKLPEILELEQDGAAQLNWESSGEEKEEREESCLLRNRAFETDYFLSLRNSTLKQSLQKESLSTMYNNLINQDKATV